MALSVQCTRMRYPHAQGAASHAAVPAYHLPLSDPQIAAIPTAECGEAMVSLHGIAPRLKVDISDTNIAGLGYRPEFLVRQSVADKLKAAALSLPEPMHLLVKESLRPAAFQEFLFKRRLAKLAAEQPELREEQRVALTARFVAPPWVAGHPTGGAVDVTLCDAHGQEADLGCAYDEDEKASGGRCFSFANNLTALAQHNRAVLFACLTSQGFVNYPFEWWHWSYGDKYWAAVTRSPAALYGATTIHPAD